MPEFKSVWSYREFANRANREHRYFRHPEDEEFLKSVLATSKDRRRQVKKGHIFWRAQLGCDWRPEYQDGVYRGDVPCPYDPERMKPFKDKATEGRVNPKGVPCLYLATQKETALSEVRPWIGSEISVGQFKTTRKLAVIDCSVRHAESILNYLYVGKEPNPEEKEKAAWGEIDGAFAAPVNPSDDMADYVATQIIAELFKNHGYDGLAYKSAFGEMGYNVALFDVEAAELINCFLYEATAIDIKFDEVANPYFVTEKGKQ